MRVSQVLYFAIRMLGGKMDGRVYGSAFFALGVMANPGVDPSRGVRTARVVWVLRVWKGGLIAAGAVMECSTVSYGRAEFYLEQAQRTGDSSWGIEDVALLARSRELDPKNPEVFLASGELRVRSGELRDPVGAPIPVLSALLWDVFASWDGVG